MKNRVFTGGLCVIAVLGFWRAHVSRSALKPGILSGQVDKRVALWNSQNTPSAGRIVDIIISDAETVALTDMTPQSSDQLSAWDSQVLTLAHIPVWKKAKAWFKRTFLRRSMACAADTQFVNAFSNDPNAVAWTHEGFATASVDEMFRELTGAIAKACDAGAEVNIVTQGVSAVPALKAVKAVKDAARKGGNAAVNKFIAVDMNRPTLQKIAPDYFEKFTRPENLREWAGIWTSGSSPKITIVELFSPKCKGTRFSCEEVFALLGMRSEVSAQDVIWLVKSLIMENAALEQVQAHLAPSARARKEAATVPAKNPMSALKKMITSQTPAEPQDSLSAINAGWLTKERAAARKTQSASADGPAGKAPASQRTGWERYDTECGKCCVDVGGTWDNGEKRHCCVGAGYNDEVPSCRVVWTDKGGRSHNCAYKFGCKGP